jgi:hypothetical protein
MKTQKSRLLFASLRMEFPMRHSNAFFFYMINFFAFKCTLKELHRDIYNSLFLVSILLLEHNKTYRGLFYDAFENKSMEPGISTPATNEFCTFFLTLWQKENHLSSIVYMVDVNRTEQPTLVQGFLICTLVCELNHISIYRIENMYKCHNLYNQYRSSL